MKKAKPIRKLLAANRSEVAIRIFRAANDLRLRTVSIDAAQKIAKEIGYPVIVKAAMGGGGRGMRVVHDAAQLDALLEEAQGEARSAFGDASVFLEKYLPRARHLEVQILADHHGNLLHLYD